MMQLKLFLAGVDERVCSSVDFFLFLDYRDQDPEYQLASTNPQGLKVCAL